MISDIIGWTGSIAFAICGLPQAWDCFKKKTAQGISPAFIALWVVGEICYIISILMKFGWVNWLMFNYIVNLVSVSVISYYVIRDRRDRGRFKEVQAQS
jgi:uncharacterized protein with PQ loop repeat